MGRLMRSEPCCDEECHRGSEVEWEACATATCCRTARVVRRTGAGLGFATVTLLLASREGGDEVPDIIP